jgi:predicted RNA-binding protein
VTARFHLFITPLYFDRCLEAGLFGVGKGQMNQIANVHAGDFAFIYTARRIGSRTRPLIYGPFRVLSEPFFNDSLVWAASAKALGKDKYPYRVKVALTPEHVCREPLPVQKLWDLREEGKVKTVIDASALTNKSVINLLPNEGRLLLEAILQFNPRPSVDASPYFGHSMDEKPIDPCEFTEGHLPEFRFEAQLETYLLQRPEVIHLLADFKLDENWQVETYNQVSTYIAGGAIDIIAIFRKQVFDMLLTIGAAIIEAKKGPLSVDMLDQLTEYMEWTARLLPGLQRDMIHGVLVGRDFGDRTEQAGGIKLKLQSLAPRYNLTAATYRVAKGVVEFTHI